MAMSFSRPDPSSPTAVSTATFSTSRRGFEQGEVRDLLRMVAAELARLQEREKFLERELRTAQRGNQNSAVVIDDEVVTRMLGEEAARILQTAREAASQIKVRAEENSSRLLREATDEAQRLREEAELESARRRQDASSDSEAELQMAKQQGREMVNEARAYRERVLGELARRRELARQQIEQLVHGRDRLLQAFERARVASVDVMAELTPLGAPDEYVNLSPTTGPVPLMVPARPVPSPEAPYDFVAEGEPEAEQVEAQDVEQDDQQQGEQEEPQDELQEVLQVDQQEDQEDDQEDEGTIAPVVSLFAGEVEAAEVDADDAPHAPKASVEDLFARLRAARTDSVIERVAEAVAEEAAAADEVEADTGEGVGEQLHSPPVLSIVADPTVQLDVFQKSPEAPVVVADSDDSAFGRRDAELTPLIVASARKLKRVLADEQNDVLHVLRRADAATSLKALVPRSAEHVQRYAHAIDAELRRAAIAGAASVDQREAAAHERDIVKAKALRPAIDALAGSLVSPLRERLERAVEQAGGDNGELASSVKAIYREWKTQRIDEHLDDVVLMAFGHGALVALTPGTPVCWAVDPNGPPCPDADDNALAGAVPAGQPFPTDHLCAPAHEGCRCMLVRAPS